MQFDEDGITCIVRGRSLTSTMRMYDGVGSVIEYVVPSLASMTIAMVPSCKIFMILA